MWEESLFHLCTSVTLTKCCSIIPCQRSHSRDLKLHRCHIDLSFDMSPPFPLFKGIHMFMTFPFEKRTLKLHSNCDCWNRQWEVMLLEAPETDVDPEFGHGRQNHKTTSSNLGNSDPFAKTLFFVFKNREKSAQKGNLKIFEGNGIKIVSNSVDRNVTQHQQQMRLSESRPCGHPYRWLPIIRFPGFFKVLWKSHADLCVMRYFNEHT